MSSTIRLPSGKLINLSRFVALYSDNNSTENNYKLSLDGLDKAINIDTTDAKFITQKLELELDVNNSQVEKQWDKAEQLRKNQPLMKLIKQWREENNGKIPTAEETQSYQDIQESLKNNRYIENA
ncbi:MAG: hypothetical protein ACRC2S_25230 [Waterburya sp.]